VLLGLTALLGTLFMRLPWPTVQLTGMFMVMVFAPTGMIVCLRGCGPDQVETDLRERRVARTGLGLSALSLLFFAV
jgi:hypothetical protein